VPGPVPGDRGKASADIALEDIATARQWARLRATKRWAPRNWARAAKGRALPGWTPTQTRTSTTTPPTRSPPWSGQPSAIGVAESDFDRLLRGEVLVDL
jgi:hypothetical protein